MTITEVIALGIGLAAALAAWAGLMLYRRAGRDGGDPRTRARRRLTALSLGAAGVSALAAVVLAAGLRGDAHTSSAAAQVAQSSTQASTADDTASADTGGTLTAPSTSPSSSTSGSGFGSGGS